MRKFALKIGLKYLLSRVNKYLKKAQKGGQLGEVRENLRKYGGYLSSISAITRKVSDRCKTFDSRLADGMFDKDEAEASIKEITQLAADIKRHLK